MATIPQETEQSADPRSSRDEQTYPGEERYGEALRAESKPDAFPATFDLDNPSQNAVSFNRGDGPVRQVVALYEET